MRGRVVIVGFMLLGCQAVIGEDFSEKQHTCFPLSNNGCNAQQTCAYSPNVTIPSCVTAGTGGQGEACTDSTQCAPGSTCWAIGGVATCHQYCAVGSQGTCPTTSLCGRFQQLDGADVGVCWPECDLRGRAVATAPFGACPNGFSCHETAKGLQCLPTGAGLDGAPCNSGSDCADGYHCFSLGGAKYVCRQYCTGDNSICPTGTTCQPLTPPIIHDGVTFDSCIP